MGAGGAGRDEDGENELSTYPKLHGEELRKNKVIVARGQCMEGGGKKVGPPGYFKAMAIVILRQLKATEEF